MAVEVPFDLLGLVQHQVGRLCIINYYTHTHTCRFLKSDVSPSLDIKRNKRDDEI